MKKIVIPVIIILMVILYLVFFRYNKIGVVEIDGYVITSENLYAKMNSSDNNDLELVEVKSLDNIYKQGNNYFIGDRSKQKVNLNYPIIATDNSRIWNYSSNTKLINDSYETIKGYSNLIVANSNVYNVNDYTQADQEMYLFISYDDSLFSNTLPIKIHTIANEFIIPEYSIISFQDTQIFYYYINNKTLKLAKITDIYNDSLIEYNEEKLTYEELLIKLNLKNTSQNENIAIEEEKPIIEDDTPSNNTPSNNDNKYVKPTVSFSNLEVNTYSLQGNLKINDESKQIKKMPSFEIYYENDIYLRKSFYESGKIELSGLVPNTKYKIVGSFVYQNEFGNQIKNIFYSEEFTTKTINELDTLNFSFSINEFFSNKIKFSDLSFTNEKDSEVLKGVKKVIIKVDDKDYLLSSTAIQNLKKGLKIEYQTPENLKSNTKYNGLIEVYDLADNKLKVTNNTFLATTIKMLPKISMEVLKTDITKFTIQVTLENPDNIYLDNFRYEIYNLDNKLIQEGKIDDKLLIEGKNLDANQIYKVVTYADYDLENGEGKHLNNVLKSILVSTNPISSLGFIRVTFNELEVFQETAKYQFKINYDAVDERLIDLLDSIVIDVYAKENDELVRELVIEGDSINLLKSNNYIEILFDNLNSNTEYYLDINSKVKQGDVSYEVDVLANLSSFKTLKKAARVEIINSFTTESIIDFDVKIVDIDEAIISNRVLLEVRNSNGTLVLMKELKINASYERITLEKLYENETYIFKFISEEYNVGFTNKTYEENKIIQEIPIKTTIGIYGDITLNSLLNQITSNNIFNIKNTRKWRMEGSSAINNLTTNEEKNTIKMSSKNNYANYSYYVSEYSGKKAKISFSIRHTANSNMQKVYLQTGGGSRHQYLLSGLSKDWKDFTYEVTLDNGYFGFYIEEISNNNTITEIEVKDLFVVVASEETLKGKTLADSYHSSGLIFKNTLLLSGNDRMPTHDGKTGMNGNSGNGYAKITNLSNNEVTIFEYTGSYQEYKVPNNGEYLIELWGAQGGNYSKSIQGGKGAYTRGIINLSSSQTLYFYVGSQPTTKDAGGYNGGGRAAYINTNDYTGGGGATDVRIVSGVWNNAESLKSRIMVAAGGGGSGIYASGVIQGGDGGGLKGEDGQGSGSGLHSVPTGATQISGGKGGNNSKSQSGMFGYAQSATGYFGTGGGGGYYGGGSGVATNSRVSSGGGGSSYISGHLGCISLENASKYTLPVASYDKNDKYSEKAKYKAEFTINLYDTKSEVTTNDFYIQILNNNKEEAVYHYDMDAHLIKDFLVNYEFQKNTNYEIKLLVKIRNRYYTINSINFKTDDEIRTISNEYELYLIHSSGNYLVINDISLESINRNIAFTFKGTIDFQGHKLVINNKNSGYVFRTISTSGKICNLDLHVKLNNPNGRNWYYGLIETNYGTISDIVVTLDESVEIPSQHNSLVTCNNYGLIEKFVVKLNSDFHTSYNSGLLAINMNGTIKNGYLYGANFRADYASGNISYKRTGVVAGQSNNSATIKNVYSLINVIAMENNPDNSYDRQVGNIVGYSNNSTFKNIYSYTINNNNRDLSKDPNIGYIGSANLENVYYVNPAIFSNSKSFKLSPIALRNIEFQEKTINSEGEFDIENFVKYGYFPHVKLNDMLPNQEYIELPIVKDDDLIDIITIDNVEENGETANVTLTIHNPSAEKIVNISIKDLTTSIISQQNSNGKSKVVITVSNPVKYISKYSVRSITSSVNGIRFLRQYEENEKVLLINLYRLVSSNADWLNIKNYPGENFRLTKNLDFSNVPNSNLGNFSGIIDGNNYTIKNINSTSGNGILINNLSGTLKNIFIEKVSKSNIPTYSGLVAIVNNGGIINNVHIKNIALPLANYTGGVAAVVYNGGLVQDSSVTDFSITNIETKSFSQVGGLIGQLQGRLSNCFGQKINIDVFKKDNIYSAGGLVGYNTGILENAYAIGKIKSSSQEIGGIVGRNTGTINFVYSNVDIYTTLGLLGGITGNSTNSRVSNTLSIGQLYTTVTTNNLRRTNGSRVLNQKNYAWNLQHINGVVTNENYGDILLTTEQLKTEYFYNSIIELSDFFNCKEVDTKGLPKLYYMNQKKILPNQEDNYLPEYQFEIQNIVIDKGVDSAILSITIDNPNNYHIKNVKVKDLKSKVTKNINTDSFTVYEMEVTPERFYDSYQLESIVYEINGVEKEYYSNTKIELQFYKNIASFDDWQNIDKNTFENYRLVNDIDFSGKTNINYGMSFNRLIGVDSGHSLKNFTLQTNKDNVYFITSIRSNINNITFENINISSNSSGSYVGVIGFTYGEFSKLNFNNININAPKIGNVGSIALNKASSLRDINLSNVIVSGSSNVGSLIGNTDLCDLNNVTLNTITVNGTGNYVGGMIGNLAYNDSTTHFYINATDVHVKTTGGSYSGIIYGYGSASYITVENSSVSGYHYVGGISGHQNNGSIINNVATNIQVTGKGNYIAGLYAYHRNLTYSYVKNSYITAETTSKYVGGLGGYGGYTIRLCGVYDTEIVGNGDYVGGIEGSAADGNRYQNAVINTTITGNNNVGGVIGGQTGTSNLNIYLNTVNATINANGSNAGGVYGYYNNKANTQNNKITSMYRNIVENSTITAASNAGGLIGKVDKEIQDSKIHSNIIVANIYTTIEGNVPGLIIGNGDVYSSNAKRNYIYIQTKLNDNIASNNEIIGINNNQYLTSNDLLTKNTYTSLGYSTSNFDFSALEQGYFPILLGVDEYLKILVPQSGIVFAARSLFFLRNYHIQFPDVMVYASDIDKFNIEFSEVNPNLSLIINNRSYPINNKVMSFYYDYNEDFSFSITDTINVKDYNIKASDLRKTILVNDNNFYYLSDDGIISNASNYKGDYIHLHGNYALTTKGNILNIKDGNLVANSIQNFDKLNVNIPLYEFKYNDLNIETYYQFSIVNNYREIPQQVLVKNSKITLIDSQFGNKKDSIIVDNYNNKDYLLALDNDGIIYSLKEKIKYPQNFKNLKIKELASNLNSSSSILMVRYDDDSVFAFDYRSGTILLSTKSKITPNILEFFNDAIKNNYSSSNTDYYEKYQEAKVFANVLYEMPIEKVITNKDSDIKQEYVESYNELKQKYELYEINNYLRGTSTEIKEIDYNKSVNDNINGNNKLTNYYNDSILDSKISGNINGVLIFIMLVFSLAIAFIILGNNFYKMRLNNKLIKK